MRATKTIQLRNWDDRAVNGDEADDRGCAEAEFQRPAATLDCVVGCSNRPFGTGLAPNLYPALRAGLISAVPSGLS